MHLLEKMAKKGGELGVSFDFNVQVETGYFYREDWKVSVRKFSKHFLVNTTGNIPDSIQKEFEKVMRMYSIEQDSDVLYLWSDETRKIKQVISKNEEIETQAMKVFSVFNSYFEFNYENSDVVVTSPIIFECFILDVRNIFNEISIELHDSTRLDVPATFNAENIDKDKSIFSDLQEKIDAQTKKIKEMLCLLPDATIELKYCFSGCKFSYDVSDPSIDLYHRVINLELEETIEETDNFLHKHQMLYQFYQVCSEEDPYFCIINDPPPSFSHDHHIFLFQTHFSFNFHVFFEKEFQERDSIQGADLKQTLRRKVKAIKLKTVLKEQFLPERLFLFIYSVCGFSMENIKKVICEGHIQEEIFKKTVKLPKKEQMFLQVEKDTYKDVYQCYEFSFQSGTLLIRKKE